MALIDPRTKYPSEFDKEPRQDNPGLEVAMTTEPDLGAATYAGSGKLAGRRALITGGDSGIGAATAIAFAREGADVAINYREQDFAEELKGWADVILDVVGGPYLEPNVKALATDGQIVVIALQGGAKGQISLGRMMPRRQSLHATTLRARPRAMKADIVRSTVENVWPLIEAGRIHPNISATFPLADAARAHDHLDSGASTGKIVLEVR